jgi:hypothetical protein
VALNANARKLLRSLGLAEPSPEDLRRWVEGREQLEVDFIRQIIRQRGVAQAIRELQQRQVPGGDLLHYLGRLAVEVHLHWRPSKAEIRRPGEIIFPSADGARRAARLSKKVDGLARGIERFQRESLPPEFVLDAWGGKVTAERGAFAETVRNLPRTLDEYAEFLRALSRWLRPPRGRRSRPALDYLTRNLAQWVLKTAKEATYSKYGVLGPLTLLTNSAYQVAGVPKRFSPDSLRRLLQSQT